MFNISISALIVVLSIVLCSSIYLIYTYTYTYTNNNEIEYVSYPDYYVEEIPDFLTHEQCDKIIELSQDKLFPSKLYNNGVDEIYDTNIRKSDQCWLTDEHDTLVKYISDKSTMVTQNNPYGEIGNQEQLQVVKYEPGGFFIPHFDAWEANEEESRLVTVLIYLNDDFIGGETQFPNINKTVTPEKGKAVVFYNTDKNQQIIKEALHGGNPVTSGQKFICNKWIRQKNKK